MNKKILFYSMMAATMIMTATTTNAETLTWDCGFCKPAGGYSYGPCQPTSILTASLDTETGVLKISGTGAMANFQEYCNDDCAPWDNNYKSIKHVVVDSGVTTIGERAFANYTNIEQVDLPRGLKEIGTSAFQNCTSLKSITLPEGVEIRNLAFAQCTGLTAVYNYSIEPKGSASNIFMGGGMGESTPINNVNLFVPPSAVEAYQAAKGEYDGEDITWKDFNSIQPIEDWIPVTGVKLDRTTIPLAPGGKATIKATIIPSNASSKFIKWGIEHYTGRYREPEIVDSMGMYVSTKTYVGTNMVSFLARPFDDKAAVDITVTTADGGFKATCKIVPAPKGKAAAAKAPAKTPAKKK
jgi:hypothetical protein